MTHDHVSILSKLSLVISILLLACGLKYSASGIDFTDEGFYLAWISNPFIYDVSATQFGFVYHPIYSLFEGSITAMRRFNILLTWGLASFLVFILVKDFAEEKITSKLTLVSISIALSSSSLAIFFKFLVTPNYNTLNFQAVLIAALGLILIIRDDTKKKFSGGVILGIGGWLSFMAKPTTAALLALMVLGYLIVTRLLALKPLLTSIFTAGSLLLASAVLIDGSITNFTERLVMGANAYAAFDSRYSATGIFVRSPRIHISGMQQFILLASCGFCIAGALIQQPKYAFIRKTFILFVYVASAATIGILMGVIPDAPNLGDWRGHELLGPSLGAGLFVIYRAIFKKDFVPSPKELWLAFFLFLLPLAIAFGSNRAYLDKLGAYGFFWILSGVVLVGPYIRENKSWQSLLPAVIATQAISVFIFQGSVAQPHRQPDLRANNAVALESPRASKLKISSGWKKYIDSATAATYQAGFQQEDPIIDLTGQSPGLLFLMGATNIGRAWFGGGYPGSSASVVTYLGRRPCARLAEAWILTEPQGPRSISNDVIKSFSANLSSDYRLVSSWMTAEGAGGYEHARKQKLYKPLYPQAVAKNCEERRQSVESSP